MGAQTAELFVQHVAVCAVEAGEQFHQPLFVFGSHTQELRAPPRRERHERRSRERRVGRQLEDLPGGGPAGQREAGGLVGGGQDVVHVHLMVVDAEGHDVARGLRVASDVEVVLQRLQRDAALAVGGAEIFLRLADGVAAVPEGVGRTGDIPAAPAVGVRSVGLDVGDAGSA